MEDLQKAGQVPRSSIRCESHMNTPRDDHAFLDAIDLRANMLSNSCCSSSELLLDRRSCERPKPLSPIRSVFSLCVPMHKLFSLAPANYDTRIHNILAVRTVEVSRSALSHQRVKASAVVV